MSNQKPTKDNAADSTPQETSEAKTKVKKPLWKRMLKLGLFLLYVLILLEVASRIYWKAKRDVPFFSGPSDWYSRFYEELKESKVLDTELKKDDGYFDVLLLGGSALDRVNTSLCNDSKELPESLEKIVGRPVRVFNLANPGMSTRDSRIKYRLMGEHGKAFDLVVVYHGINDIRLNNCPPEKFRNDYTHAGWYKQIQMMENQLGLLRVLTLPFTVQYTVVHAMSSKKFEFYVPRHKLNPAWMEHGGEIKTEGPFRENVQAILDMAKQRGEPVLLTTFAWYLPEGYTLEKLRAGKLDYIAEDRPDGVENWGKSENVAKGMDIHNRVIRELAKGNPEVLFVDVDQTVPKQGLLFNDICHLSEAGKRRYLQAILPAIQQMASPTSAPVKP